jgi:hypothetical protein
MSQVRAIASAQLRYMSQQVPGAGTSPTAAHGALLASDIKRFLDRPAPPATATPLPAAPPGAPIGEPAMEWLRRIEPACSIGGFDHFNDSH